MRTDRRRNRAVCTCSEPDLVNKLSKPIGIVAHCLTVILSLKGCCGPSSCFPLSLPNSCFLSLPARLSFLSTEEACLILQSPAVLTLWLPHQVNTPLFLSPLLNKRTHFPYSFTEIPKSPHPALIQKSDIFCCFSSRKQQNHSFIQKAAEATLRTAVLGAYGPCSMKAMSAMYFIRCTVAIIVIPSRA